MSFFASRSNLEAHYLLFFIIYHLIIQIHCFSLGYSWLWKSPRCFLFLMTLTSFRSIGQVFYRIPFCWDLSNVFRIMNLWLWLFGRRTQKLSAIFITLYQRYIISTWLPTIDDNLEHLTEVMFVKLSYYKESLFFNPIFMLYSLEWSNYAELTYED